MLVGTLAVNLKALTAGFSRDMKAAAQAMRDVGGEMRDLAGTAALATAALGGVAAAAIKASSDFDETSNVIQTAFGSSSVQIEGWAKTTAEAMGRSTQQMREFVGVSQGMLFGLTGSRTAAMDMSKGLTQLAVDMGSFFNVADKEAFDALKSAITGETEPMKRFGVVMLESTLQAYALSKGITKKMDAMSEAEKVALRYEFIMSRTALAQGDAVKTATSFANSMKRLQAGVSDLAVAFGDALKPIAADVVGILTEAVTWVKQLDQPTMQLAASVTAAAIAGGALFAALFSVGGAVAAIAAALPAVIAGFGTLLTTILPIVVIVGTLVFIVGLLADNWDDLMTGMRDSTSGIVAYLKDAFTGLVDGLKTAMTAITTLMVQALLLPVRAIREADAWMTAGVERLVKRLEPLAEMLGIGDKFGDLKTALAGMRAEAIFDARAVDTLERELIEAADPNNIFGATVDYWSTGGAGYEAISDAMSTAGEMLGLAAESSMSGLKTMLGAIFGIDFDKVGFTAPKKGVDQPDVGSTAPAGKAAKAPKEPRSLGEWLADGKWDTELGKHLAGEMQGQLVDTALAGRLFDLGSLGSAIGAGLAGPVGAQVGGAVGDAISTALQALVDTIVDLGHRIVQGISDIATTIAETVFSGSQKAAGVFGAVGQGVGAAGSALGVAAAAAGLGTLLATVGVAAAALASGFVATAALLATIFFPVALVIVGVVVPALLALGAAWAILSAPAVLLTGAFAALYLSIFGIIGIATGLLVLGTMSKSFERFSLVLDAGFRLIIEAVEPLYQRLMPLAVIFFEIAGVAASVVAALVQIPGVAEWLFDATKSVAMAFLQIVKSIAGMLQLSDVAASAGTALATLAGLTYDAAAAKAAEIAAAEELAQSMDAAGASASALNVPTGYFTERRRGDVAGGDMQALLDALAGGGAGSASTTVVIESVQVRNADDFFDLVERLLERRNSNSRGLALSGLGLQLPASRRR